MPTLTFCCSSGCGIVAAGAAPGAGGRRHWDAIGGSGIDPVAGGAPSWWLTGGGGPSTYRFAEVGNGRFWQRSLDTAGGSPIGMVIRFALGFETLPGVQCDVLTITPNAGQGCAISVDSSNRVFSDFFGQVAHNGPTLLANQRYVIDLMCDFSNNPSSVTWAVDGVSQGTFTFAQVATTLLQWRFGLQSSITATFHLGDLAMSETLGDYPIGAGRGIALVPTADGTHNFDTPGDFTYNNTTNVAVGATDTFSYIDDFLDNVTDFLAVPAASNTEYLEWQFANLGPVLTINGVEVVMASHASASTPANKQTLRLNDGGTLSDVCTDLDQSQTTVTHHCKHYAVAPSSSAAWTKAKVDALLARWNSSYGTVGESAVPFIDALVLEVDYIAGASGPMFRPAA